MGRGSSSGIQLGGQGQPGRLVWPLECFSSPLRGTLHYRALRGVHGSGHAMSITWVEILMEQIRKVDLDSFLVTPKRCDGHSQEA